MMRIGVFSGSFDPPTKGHEWIIQESHESYDLFYVVIGFHPDKDFLYTEEQRISMLEFVVPDGVIIDCIWGGNFKQYLKKLRHKHPESEVTLVRGIRNTEDFD